ncbi:MAG: glycine cleavage system aminomethyltransferase GcvT [Nitrospinaceae bacterium]|nr:MAG: glycine cleavage system aminomethyltransferase GcvT [Nitrospinaceae bacterium]
MSQGSSTSLRTTPLFEVHKELGAKMVPFAGWSMPIQYAGVIQEHLAVRDGVGLFDVSHMGEIDLKGEGARALLQNIFTNDVGKMGDGSILYTLMCTGEGGIVDDLLVHRFAEDHYFLCVNASNTEKDFRWIKDRAGSFEVEISDISLKTAQLALQGKHAEALLQPLCDVSLEDLRYYHFKKGKIHNNDCIISRTGYTGEDGFEIYTGWGQAEPLFRRLLDAGRAWALKPVGLAARDTLRLEMGYALYGNDISDATGPLEAGLGWVVKPGKGEFIGRAAIAREKESGPARKLVGLALLERGVPRPHYRILQDGEPVGELTSGTFSPSLNKGIALGYVPRELAAPGTRLDVEIRNQPVAVEVVTTPFLPSRVKK